MDGTNGSQQSVEVFGSRAAMAVWASAAVVLLSLLSLTCLVWFSGPLNAFSMPETIGVLTLLWMLGVGVMSHALGARAFVIEVDVSRGSLRATVTRPWRRRRLVVATRHVGRAEVRQVRGGLGDSYFVVETAIGAGPMLVVAIAGERAMAEDERRRFNQAIGRQ